MTPQELIRHYQDLLKKHGPGPHAVQYADEPTQQKRFEILMQIADPLTSVIDVGCGLAHLAHFLYGQGFTGRYLGVDVVPEFVEIAAASLAHHPDADVVLSDGRNELPRGCDYALLSGVFNNLMDDNWGFMTQTLRRMWAAADKGIAFNAMSTYVDYQDDGLFYVDPMRVLDFCKRELGGHPLLRHDYAMQEGGFPFEFAMYVYKEPRA